MTMNRDPSPRRHARVSPIACALLRTHGISHEELAQAVKQSSGKPLSRTALSFLMNYGEWPPGRRSGTHQARRSSSTCARTAPRARSPESGADEGAQARS
jgi:hypothetical protein